MSCNDLPDVIAGDVEPVANDYSVVEIKPDVRKYWRELLASSAHEIWPTSSTPFMGAAYYLIGNTQHQSKSIMAYEELLSDFNRKAPAMGVKPITREPMERYLLRWAAGTGLDVLENSYGDKFLEGIAMRKHALSHDQIMCFKEGLAAMNRWNCRPMMNCSR